MRQFRIKPPDTTQAIHTKPPRRFSPNHFLPWLKAQSYRGGPVGDLARALVRNKEFQGKTYSDLRTYLHESGASIPTISALKTARKEYLVLKRSKKIDL